MAADRNDASEADVRAAIDVLIRSPGVVAALARVGVFAVDHRSCERSYNDAHFDLGLENNAFPSPDSWLEQVHPEDRARVEALWAEVLEGRSDTFLCEFRFRNAHGEYHWLRNRGTIVYRTPEGEPWLYVGADTDLSEVRRVQAELSRLTITDPVLKILNRRGLHERGRQLAMESRQNGLPLGLLVIDIDHFKRINDEVGHDAADRIMKELVDAVRRSIRAVDTLGRFGGDEFVVLLPDADLDQVARVAFRVSTEARSVGRCGASFDPTVTIGATSGVPTTEDGFRSLFRQADEALFEGKTAQRGGVQIAPLHVDRT